VSLFAGLVGTFVPDGSGGLFPDSPGAQSDMLYGVVIILLAAATSGVGVFFIGKHFGTIPIIGRLVLAEGVAKQDDERVDAELAAAAPAPTAGPRVGAVGTSITPLRPSGSVDVDGEVVDAVSESGFIEASERVTLIERRGFSWVVEPAGVGPEGEGRA
jgi:membrane-bound serine protease (ClpP class)